MPFAELELFEIDASEEEQSVLVVCCEFVFGLCAMPSAFVLCKKTNTCVTCLVVLGIRPVEGRMHGGLH